MMGSADIYERIINNTYHQLFTQHLLVYGTNTPRACYDETRSLYLHKYIESFEDDSLKKEGTYIHNILFRLRVINRCAYLMLHISHFVHAAVPIISPSRDSFHRRNFFRHKSTLTCTILRSEHYSYRGKK